MAANFTNGVTWADTGANAALTAARLSAAVTEAKPTVELINERTASAAATDADVLLVSSGGTTLKKMTRATFLTQPTITGYLEVTDASQPNIKLVDTSGTADTAAQAWIVNAGGLIQMQRRDVSGTLISTPFYVRVSTQEAIFGGTVLATGFIAGSSPGITTTVSYTKSGGGTGTLTFTGGILTAST